MDDYMRYLIEQYKKARGIFGININSQEFKDDFNRWLKQYQENCVNYASFLYSIGIDFTESKLPLSISTVFFVVKSIPKENNNDA